MPLVGSRRYKMEKIDTNNLPGDIDHHAYLNTEKINEIIEWIKKKRKEGKDAI